MPPERLHMQGHACGDVRKQRHREGDEHEIEVTPLVDAIKMHKENITDDRVAKTGAKDEFVSA